jgi:hypothetical protein
VAAALSALNRSRLARVVIRENQPKSAQIRDRMLSAC